MRRGGKREEGKGEKWRRRRKKRRRIRKRLAGRAQRGEEVRPGRQKAASSMAKTGGPQGVQGSSAAKSGNGYSPKPNGEGSLTNWSAEGS